MNCRRDGWRFCLSVAGDIDGDGDEDFTILLVNDGFGALSAPVTLINFRL